MGILAPVSSGLMPHFSGRARRDVAQRLSAVLLGTFADPPPLQPPPQIPTPTARTEVESHCLIRFQNSLTREGMDAEGLRDAHVIDLECTHRPAIAISLRRLCEGGAGAEGGFVPAAATHCSVRSGGPGAVKPGPPPGPHSVGLTINDRSQLTVTAKVEREPRILRVTIAF